MMIRRMSGGEEPTNKKKAVTSGDGKFLDMWACGKGMWEGRPTLWGRDACHDDTGANDGGEEEDGG